MRLERGHTAAATFNVGSRSPAPAALQRKCACEESGQSCERCGKKKQLQRHRREAAPASRGAIPPAVNQVVSSPGQPIDAGTRAFMEPRFGYDFSHVRIHSDSRARRSADDVHANAYTVGNHIVVGQEGGHANRRLMAHELAHVVQQSRGGVPPGIDGDPALEHGAERAAAQVTTGQATSGVAGASGIGIARDAKANAPTAEPTYEVNFPDGKKRLTATEFAAYKDQATQRLRRRLQLLADLAELGRASQIDMLKEYHGGVESLWDVVKKPKSLIGIASDIKAGVTPPYIGMWTHPKNAVAQGLAALDRGDLGGGAHALTRADQSYHDCMREWNAYREATIGGAEKVASNLETVRDVSFAIALVAGAVVAAPVIAAGVAATGATGVVATGLTALGTAGVTGAGGVTLGGGSAALGSFAATGKVDTKDALDQAKKWGKQGAVTGLTAGFGSAIGGAGKAAELAKPFAQQAVRRCLADAGINVAGEITSQGLDKLLPDAPHGAAPGAEAPKSMVPGPVRAAVAGCISGALGVPIGKIPSGATKKAADLTIGAGVGYADARLSGQTHDQAVNAAMQNAATSAALGHAQAPKAHPAAPPRTPTAAADSHPTAKPRHQPEAHAPAAAAPHAAPKAAEPPPPAQPSHPKEASTPTQSAAAKKPAAAGDAPHPAEKPAPLKGHAGDAAPAILKEEALATRPTKDGHDVVVTKDGVGRCSPSPCPVIHVEFARELEAHPALKKQNDEIQALRKTNPAEAALQAEALIRTLEAERHNQAAAAQRPRDETDDLIDRAFDEATSRKAGKTAGSTAPQEHPTAQDISLNIDEILPVGGRATVNEAGGGLATVSEKRTRALDLNNREFKDALTNQRTKHTKIDPRDLERLQTVREPISLEGKRTTPEGKVIPNYQELWQRRFSEIKEMKAIGERVLNDMKDKGTRSPRDLKADLNRRIWDEIKARTEPDGRIVADAIERSGMGIVKAPNGQMVLRGLTATELRARGLTFVENEGWTRPGGAQ